MQSVISSSQMKRLDKLAIESFGLPSRLLMENAGKGCADFMADYFSEELEMGAIVLCGYGNNGGDGYVLARWLHYYGYPVSIVRVGEGKSSEETLANRELCSRLKLETVSTEMEGFEDYLEALLAESGAVIDAIYGIGFKGSLKGVARKIINQVNEADLLKVAIDIPSGVNADTGVADLAFEADVTLTMEAMKYGHLLEQGKLCSGWVEVIPIGIPEELLEEEDLAVLLDENTTYLPFRNKYAHKGDYGRIAVFAGSPGMTGAAFLASKAALKAGAGLVTLFCHPNEMVYYSNKPYEVMIRLTPLNKQGRVDKKALAEELKRFDVVLFGPGCGVNDYTLQVLEFLAAQWKKPAVIDADGLNTLSQHPELLIKLADKPVVLTPHWGEFCRLAGIEMVDLHNDCISSLKEFADKYSLNILLKSHTTIYYDGDFLSFNTSGNDGLATGGSGDVLAGVIAGFIAQKMPYYEAAIMAAYYLGLTAEVLSEQKATLSITPSDILEHIFRFEPLENESCDA